MKKCLFALLILALIITSACVVVNAGTAPDSVSYMVGDADGDNTITVLDATKVQRVLADLDDDTDGMIALRASVDGEKLNIMHATFIQRWLADYTVEYPIGETVTVTPTESSTESPTIQPTQAPTTPPTQAPTRDPDELPFVPKK